jgi:hypothetical protein
MLIRQKYHWILLFNMALYSCLGIFTLGASLLGSRHDPFYTTFMVPFWISLAAISAIAWSSNYTSLSNGVLTKHVFFLTFRSFPVGEITRIEPHKKDGKKGYGTVVNIFSSEGQKLTLQPNHPVPFLTALHQQAPQAEYLL